MDEAQFEKLIWPHRNEMLRMGLFVARNEELARDAVQEVLIRCWNKRAQLEKIQNIKAFLMRSVRNEILDHFKKSNKTDYMEETPETNLKISSDNIEQTAENIDIYSTVKSAIMQLPEKQSTIMMLKDIEGYDFEEIASITGMQEGAIRVNLSRARKNVKNTLINKNIYAERISD